MNNSNINKNAEYYYGLGLAMVNGELGRERSIEAAENFEKAAELGSVSAMYELGMCYRWGDGGVYADPDTAIEWFKKAAEGGDERAVGFLERFDSPSGRQVLLMSAMSGVGGQGSKWYVTKMGVEYYYSQAKAGNAECQYELARQLSMESHIGPFKYDIHEAIRWYTESGNNGVVDAMFNLANIYYYGKSDFAPDRDKARYWFTKCAQAGDAEAAEIIANEEKWK